MKTEQSLTSPKAYGTLEPTTEERFYEMLECVPPAHMAGGRFAVGEPYADRYQFGGEFDDDEMCREVYDCYYQIGRDDNATFLHGYFTIKDYKDVTVEQLKAAKERLQ